MFAFNSVVAQIFDACAATKDGASSSAAVGFKRLSKATTVRVGGARKEATTSVLRDAETPAARGFDTLSFLEVAPAIRVGVALQRRGLGRASLQIG